ncbi:uncharacterized protein LOC124313505 [Daphnia pulicaria]|uniref:uncharacterized protein LOC124313505 n=1 Tax=Daphnia pulicaria TaxID=35523 RepID=UPI001EEB4721|nr:uncharacterized protein LOC124313505 [Daphnia pulicaria]
MRFHHLLIVCVCWLAVLSTTSATFSRYRFKRPYFAVAPVASGWPAGQNHQVPLQNAFAPASPAFGGIRNNGMRFRRQRPITQRPVNRWRFVHTRYDYEHPDHHHIYHS